MDKIVTYSLSENFIQNLGGFVEENFIRQGRDISRLAFVFPGRRPALFLKRELAARAAKTFFAPRFFSIDEFVEYTAAQRGVFSKISDLEAAYLIYEIAKQKAPGLLKGKELFSKFLAWAREILLFFEQLDLEDVRVKSLKDIQLGAGIGYDVPDSINSLLKNVVSLRGAFHDALLEKKSYSRGLVYLLASGAAAEVPFEEFDRIMFCNFFYLHKTEEAIFKSLYDRDKATLFFQGSAGDWPVLEDISKKFSCSIAPQGPPAPEPRLSIQAGFDLHSQAGLVREALKGIKDHDKTVVVLPEAGHVIPLLSEISCLVEEFNVSMGYPLTRSSLYSLFGCVFKAQETRKKGAYYSKDYLEVLSHPLVKNLGLKGSASVTRILVHKIEEVLLGIEATPLAGSLFVKLADLESLQELSLLAKDTMKRMDIEVSAGDLKDMLKQLHQAFFASWEDIGDLAGLAGRLEAFLELIVEKSFLTKYPLNLKIAERIFSLLDELKAAAFSREKFSQEEVFKIFKDSLENEKVSFSGSPLKGLQVLGFLETRSLNFENVIVLDTNESLLPKIKIREPLIPREVMLRLGINRLEKEEEIQRYHFMSLIGPAKNVLLVYQEGKDKERSRFIEDLIWQKERAAKEPGVLSIPKADFRVKVLPREIAIKKKASCLDFLKDFEFSATSVNTYLDCPLRFYYQHVLGLREKEDLLDEPEGRDIGNFVHSLLEETFAGFIGKKPKIDARFEGYFFKALDKKFDKEFRAKGGGDAFLVKEILDFRLQNFLENEKKRPVATLLNLEKDLKDRIVLAGRPFSFKCRIDRIDELGDGSLLILDYKTGSSDIMPGSVERLGSGPLSRPLIKAVVKSFQLPLYVHFVRQQEPEADINAALYLLRNPQKNKALKPLFKEGLDPARKARLLETFMKALEFIVSEIVDPAVPFAADIGDAHYCRNCPFFYLCR